MGLKVGYVLKAATDIRNLGVRFGSFSATHSNYLSVPCVLFAASHDTLFSVAYGES